MTVLATVGIVLGSTARADVIYEWVPTSPATVVTPLTGVPTGETVPFAATITLTDEAVAAGGSEFRLNVSRSSLPQPPFDPLATDPLTLSYVTSDAIADFQFAFGSTTLMAGAGLSGDAVLGWLEPYFDSNGVNPGFPNGIFEFDLSIEGDELLGSFDVVGLFQDFRGVSDELWSFDFNADGGGPCRLTGACQDATGRFVRRDALTVSEPGTLAVLFPAFGPLGFAAWRRVQ